MKKFMKYAAALVAATTLSAPALAADAKSLDELLQMIQSQKMSESKEYNAREAAFNRDKSKQAAALKSAQAESRRRASFRPSRSDHSR